MKISHSDKVLSQFRVIGYHDSFDDYCALVIEEVIINETVKGQDASDAWKEGKIAREQGALCGCEKCVNERNI